MIRLQEIIHSLEEGKWGKRIREPEQGPDGAIYVLEDGEGGRLLRLTPAE